MRAISFLVQPASFSLDLSSFASPHLAMWSDSERQSRVWQVENRAPYSFSSSECRLLYSFSSDDLRQIYLSPKQECGSDRIPFYTMFFTQPIVRISF
jgi:hypothetical protein